MAIAASRSRQPEMVVFGCPRRHHHRLHQRQISRCRGRTRRSRALGRNAELRANCSGILGPVITGVLVDATDSYWSAFLVAGAFTLAAAWFWGAVVPRVEPVRWEAA
jgi:hypothetical protein